MAEDEKIPFIGQIPIDPAFTAQMDDGRSFVEKFKDAKSLSALTEFVEKLLENNKHPRAVIVTTPQVPLAFTIILIYILLILKIY